jgi:hypothetical protein
VAPDENSPTQSTLAFDRKTALKKSLASNLRQILKRRNIKVAELTLLLNEKGSDINDFAVRSWLRQSERRPTLPSCQNLACLSEVLGVSMQELLGMNSMEGYSFYQKLREPEDQHEREILNRLSTIRKEYDARAKDPDFKQPPLRTIVEAEAGAMERKSYYYLLSNDLVRINPQAVERDTLLEGALSRAWERCGNGSIIDHACVYKLPGKVSDAQQSYRGIAEIVFFRCAAQYLIDNVFRSGCTIGIAGGKTMASIMKLLPRSENLHGCNFFPLATSTSFFSDAPVGSAAVISDLLFRYGDLGIRMPDNIDQKEAIETWVNVADVLAFSLGGAEHSSIFNLLRRIRQTTAPEEREKLRSVLAGDILFQVFTKSGKTLEEIAGDPSNASPDEKSLADELIGLQCSTTPTVNVNGHAKHVQTRKDYTKLIADTRIDLSIVKRHAKRPNRRTILIVAGADKLPIMQVFRTRICEPAMRFTLITEQSVAQSLLESLD